MHPRNAHLISSERASRISGMCVSILLNMHKKNIYRLFATGFSLPQHAACPLAHIRAPMCANGHVGARCKKHRVEHKLSDIFEAL
jgi:hypothetical protein